MSKHDGFLHQLRNTKTTDVWITPKWLIDMIGPFDLDPCANDPRPFDCALTNYTEIDDGLSLPWEGFVFMNPPYGTQTGEWLDKMAQHNNGIALVFARTAVKWFHRNVPKSSAFLLPNHLIKFIRPDGTEPKHAAPAGSILVGYGETGKERLFKASVEYNFGMLCKVIHA